MEVGSSGQHIRKCPLPCWHVNFTHWGQFSPPPISCSPLPSPSQPILIAHPFSFASVASPSHFSLSPPTALPNSPSQFPEQSCLSSCLYQALSSSPWEKTAAELPCQEQIPCLGSRIICFLLRKRPSQSYLFPHFPKPCLSTSAPWSLQRGEHQAQGA